jgi:DtxR family Mn-dependent transcriptional regulator
VQHVGYAWDEVHDEAEVLEHAMSDRLLDAIDEQLGHPRRDPHGDPIPRSDGTIDRPDAVLLRDAGSGGIVVRISDRDPALLRHLRAEGISLDSEITADRRDELVADALTSIWVRTPERRLEP